MLVKHLLEDKVKNFVPPKQSKDHYNDRMVWHGGSNVTYKKLKFSFTGKVGKNRASSKQSFEYRNQDDGDRRIWVTLDGEISED